MHRSYVIGASEFKFRLLWSCWTFTLHFDEMPEPERCNGGIEECCNDVAPWWLSIYLSLTCSSCPLDSVFVDFPVTTYLLPVIGLSACDWTLPLAATWPVTALFGYWRSLPAPMTLPSVFSPPGVHHLGLFVFILKFYKSSVPAPLSCVYIWVPSLCRVISNTVATWGGCVLDLFLMKVFLIVV